MKYFITLSFLFPIVVIAGGHGGQHVPSVKDVLWPAFNFFLLFGTIGFMLKKPLVKAFVKNAEIIEETYRMAETESEIASKEIDEVQKKMESFEDVKEEINSKLNLELEEFNEKIEQETKIQISSMKSDNVQKIEYEKLQLLQELNSEIVDQIIVKTKKTISGDPIIKSDVTKKLIAGLQ